MVYSILLQVKEQIACGQTEKFQIRRAAVSSLVQIGISMGVSAVIGGTMSALSGDGFMSGFWNGLASGFMWGEIFAGLAQMASGAKSVTRSLVQNFNGKTLGKVKIWSPNFAGNPTVDGTLIKFGKVK